MDLFQYFALLAEPRCLLFFHGSFFPLKFFGCCCYSYISGGFLSTQPEPQMSVVTVRRVPKGSGSFIGLKDPGLESALNEPLCCTTGYAKGVSVTL